MKKEMYLIGIDVNGVKMEFNRYNNLNEAYQIKDKLLSMTTTPKVFEDSVLQEMLSAMKYKKFNYSIIDDVVYGSLKDDVPVAIFSLKC